MRTPRVERWRPVVGFSGYEVSDAGRVRSYRGPGKSKRPLEVPRIRKLVPIKRGGYLTVVLRRDGKSLLRYVHQLVLEAFRGSRPSPKHVARHVRERDVRNNRLGNLRWGTPSQNVRDQVRHGTDTRGEKNGGAKLTQGQADEIRSSPEKGVDLAARFGVTQATICRVRKGIRYPVRRTR